jgi:hypothetical protein
VLPGYCSVFIFTPWLSAGLLARYRSRCPPALVRVGQHAPDPFIDTMYGCGIVPHPSSSPDHRRKRRRVRDPSLYVSAQQMSKEQVVVCTWVCARHFGSARLLEVIASAGSSGAAIISNRPRRGKEITRTIIRPVDAGIQDMMPSTTTLQFRSTRNQRGNCTPISPVLLAPLLLGGIRNCTSQL